ncbi:PAS domain S-box protein [Luteimonas yindakuii]|uniref:PAS domain S-box protein n=1 Tax=Luteimonas yindakuii TaxID=2565782 RepID=A0A4Z1RH39_9GAMM|nr:PAS domain S-box protein [Luteimonas yindakuii]QCO67709.1 PAS domain S-box protein [Luteimonas yindakuii]TKS53997.1 PAS domain S-box protein [Luteimonas yindakuii]
MAAVREGDSDTARARGADLRQSLAGIRWWIPLLYLLLSAAWILFSDLLVEWLLPSATVRAAQSAKGLLFVLATAAGLWLLLRNQARGIERAHRATLDYAQRYRGLLDRHPDPLWLHEAGSGRLLYVNPAARAFFGLGAEDALPGDAADLQGVLPHPGEEGRPATIRRIRLPDGRRRDVELHVARLDHDGREARLVSMRDRTAEIGAERERAQSARRMREAQQLACLGSWEFDPASGRGHLSDETCRILGIRVPAGNDADVRGLLLDALPGWAAELSGLLDALASGHGPPLDVVIPVDTPDGTRRLQLRGARATEDGTAHLLRGTLQDITEAEAARRQLRERERQFRDLIRALPDGVVLLAGDRVRYANPACAEAFGRPVESMPGLPVQELVAEDDAPLLGAWLRAALVSGQVPDAAVVRAPRMRRSDGSLFNAALTAAETRYEDTICTVVVMRDLSDAERMRDELAAGNLQLQAMAARIFSVQEDERRRISRDLHDDIGQSITAIKMSASAAMDEDDPARRHDDLDDVLALADATLSRLRDISILLRPPQLDALGLEAALRWHAERLFTHAGVGLELSIAALPRRPEREVEQACFRIAQEAMTNALRHAAPARVSLRLEDSGDRLHLRVVDDGRGFDTPADGGLGLAIMRERAHGVGGVFDIRSLRGHGTTVEAVLPYDPAANAKHAGQRAG